jgi:hypothetical protein
MLQIDQNFKNLFQDSKSIFIKIYLKWNQGITL